MAGNCDAQITKLENNIMCAAHSVAYTPATPTVVGAHESPLSKVKNCILLSFIVNDKMVLLIIFIHQVPNRGSCLTNHFLSFKKK